MAAADTVKFDQDACLGFKFSLEASGSSIAVFVLDDNDNDNDNMFYFLLTYISRKLISKYQDIYFPTDQQEKGASEAQLINDAPFFTITISYINRRDIFTFQYLIAYSCDYILTHVGLSTLLCIVGPV